jgi:hypothetical protein
LQRGPQIYCAMIRCFIVYVVRTKSDAYDSYHVALQDTYIRVHWGEIYALCRFNSLPFNSTG